MAWSARGDGPSGFSLEASLAAWAMPNSCWTSSTLRPASEGRSDSIYGGTRGIGIFIVAARERGVSQILNKRARDEFLFQKSMRYGAFNARFGGQSMVVIMCLLYEPQAVRFDDLRRMGLFRPAKRI